MVVEGTGNVDVVCDEPFDYFAAGAGAQLTATWSCDGHIGTTKWC